MRTLHQQHLDRDGTAKPKAGGGGGGGGHRDRAALPPPPRQLRREPTQQTTPPSPPVAFQQALPMEHGGCLTADEAGPDQRVENVDAEEGRSVSEPEDGACELGAIPEKFLSRKASTESMCSVSSRNSAAEL
jgi:hypothetical protein